MAKGMYVVNPSRPGFNAMFFGEPGCGKTTMAATAQDCPQMSDVVFMNIEGGLLSVAHRGDIRAVDIADTAELERQFWLLKKRDKDSGYDTVRTAVIDSGTELQTLDLQEIVTAAMTKMSKSGKQRSIDDIWQEDYGKSTAHMRRVFRMFKALPHNVIITALAKNVYPKSVTNEAEAKALGVEPLIVMPSMTQKVAESVMGYMDFVWYLFYDQEDQKYKMCTKTVGPYRAKTRGPFFQKALGDIVEQQSLRDIYDLYVRVESEAQSNLDRSRRPTKRGTAQTTTTKEK